MLRRNDAPLLRNAQRRWPKYCSSKLNCLPKLPVVLGLQKQLKPCSTEAGYYQTRGPCLKPWKHITCDVGRANGVFSVNMNLFRSNDFEASED